MTKTIDTMSKDELLDRTAILGIEADYTMSSKKLREILKKFESEQTIKPVILEPDKKVLDKFKKKFSELQRQERIKTQY